MEQTHLPKDVKRIDHEQSFTFRCHSQVTCFTDCCRQLELALTPYDVLRLKRETKLDSSSFLDRYVIEEQEPEDAFPRFYLTMVDDGLASCVFITTSGCQVYQGRPGACRAYPLGRAAIRHRDHAMEEFFVLLREPHCHGFKEQEQQDPRGYCKDQGLEDYNSFNDQVAGLLQHDFIRQGMRLDTQKTNYFTLALYDLDTFRSQLDAGKLPKQGHYPGQQAACLDDERLLLFGIQWLHEVLFT